MESDVALYHVDVDMSTVVDDDADKDLDKMKKKFKEMEGVAIAFRQMQAEVEKGNGAVQYPAKVVTDQESREGNGFSVHLC